MSRTLKGDHPSIPTKKKQHSGIVLLRVTSSESVKIEIIQIGILPGNPRATFIQRMYGMYECTVNAHGLPRTHYS